MYTVRDKGWNGIQNGQLLNLLLAEEFDALFNFDKNLTYQQNFSKHPITVFVLHAHISSYAELTKLSLKILDHLNHPPLGQVAITISLS